MLYPPTKVLCYSQLALTDKQSRSLVDRAPQAANSRKDRYM